MKKRDEQDDDSDSEKDEDDDDDTNPLNLAGVMYYANPSDDPYLSKGKVLVENIFSETIKDKANLIKI